MPILIEIIICNIFVECNKSWDIIKLAQTGQQPPSTTDTPPYMADIISQCWSMNPQDRPDMNTCVEILKKEQSTTLSLKI